MVSYSNAGIQVQIFEINDPCIKVYIWYKLQPNFVTMDGQLYSLQPQIVTPTVSTVIDPGLNMLLSETRMTNAELRMGMSKIGDNVQKLLDKVVTC